MIRSTHSKNFFMIHQQKNNSFYIQFFRVPRKNCIVTYKLFNGYEITLN
jgi:hypothetical protein